MTHVVISNSMLAAAGGRLDPAYWLALKQLADEMGKPLHAETIPEIVEAGRQRHILKMAEARRLRDKSNEILEVARGIEAEVYALHQFTSKVHLG
jgi:hypothetical protein